MPSLAPRPGLLDQVEDAQQRILQRCVAALDGVHEANTQRGTDHVIRMERRMMREFNATPEIADRGCDRAVDLNPIGVAHPSTTMSGAMWARKSALHHAFGITSGLRPRSQQARSAKFQALVVDRSGGSVGGAPALSGCRQ